MTAVTPLAFTTRSALIRRLRATAAASAIALTGAAGLASGGAGFAHADTRHGCCMVMGRIEQAYNYLGGPSIVGYPIGREAPDRRGGRFQAFQSNHAIYWNPRVAGGVAHMVNGAIASRWAQLGWETSYLGYPVTNPIRLADGGVVTHFEHGSIYWKFWLGARVVRGKIRNEWYRNGAEHGRYGYPVSEQYAVPGGLRQRFQHGVITVSF